MSRVVVVVALTLLVLALQAQALAQSAAVDGWELVWSDEFEGDRLDPEKWRIEDAAVTKNNELQFYLPDEVYLEDGCLVLRSQRREVGGREYTSGLVDTQDRFARAFGRFEVRARLPKGQGVWPAHWLLPEDHPSWPPEIDIMELLGHEPRTVHMTQHWGTWPKNAHHGAEFEGPDFSAEFHVFAVEWSPDRIDWFIDGELRHSSAQSVPRIPFYLILNTAVGGDWPGNPDESTSLPQYHVIDYVRVYDRPLEGRVLLTSRSRNGAIEARPETADFAPGETVALRAVPDFGFRFCGWSGIESSAPEVEITMDRARHVEAHFEPDPRLPPLISSKGTATASSVESVGVGPANLIDGRPGTRWSSAHSDPQSVTIDLGHEHAIHTVRVIWERAHASRFRLLFSEDGERWAVVTEAEKSDHSPDVIHADDQVARYVRIECPERATQWGVSIWECEIYGHPIEP